MIGPKINLYIIFKFNILFIIIIFFQKVTPKFFAEVPKCRNISFWRLDRNGVRTELTTMHLGHRGKYLISEDQID